MDFIVFLLFGIVQKRWSVLYHQGRELFHYQHEGTRIVAFFSSYVPFCSAAASTFLLFCWACSFVNGQSKIIMLWVETLMETERLGQLGVHPRECPECFQWTAAFRLGKCLAGSSDNICFDLQGPSE